jgi:hypothetical protein
MYWYGYSVVCQALIFRIDGAIAKIVSLFIEQKNAEEQRIVSSK